MRKGTPHRQRSPSAASLREIPHVTGTVRHSPLFRPRTAKSLDPYKLIPSRARKAGTTLNAPERGRSNVTSFRHSRISIRRHMSLLIAQAVARIKSTDWSSQRLGTAAIRIAPAFEKSARGRSLHRWAKLNTHRRFAGARSRRSGSECARGADRGGALCQCSVQGMERLHSALVDHRSRDRQQ